MGSVVARWTGREARALREAKRMSVREFAAHLGVNDAAVSNWERRGSEARLRYDTQQLLDTDLARSGADVADRLTLILRSEAPGESTRTDTGARADTHADGNQLGAQSGQRTQRLLEATAAAEPESIDGPDDAAALRFQQFLDSSARVFVLTGPAGTGKTWLTDHLARTCSDQIDFQLHSCSLWPTAVMDLATEILRYASLPSGEDPLLRLERGTKSLSRPCVVVIDGVDTEQRVATVGREVDSILRQADGDRLRFLIVARTPPEPDLTAFPVLAAATFGPLAQTSALSHAATAWTLAEARRRWDRDRLEDQITFSDLPESLQTLARTPLYLQMLRTARPLAQPSSAGGTANAFRLVDHCVRTSTGADTKNVEAVIEYLGRLACHEMSDAIPQAVAGALPSFSPDQPNAQVVDAASVLVEHGADGRARFTHEVFREYFVAVRIVDEMAARGRSAATVAAFNDLASRAARSASVRGVFDFTVCALERGATHLIEVIAMAPSINLDTALPMLLQTSASYGGLLSAEVVRACAQRCARAPSPELARALLATPNIAEALGAQHAAWVVDQLRTHGYDIWTDLVRHIEHALDIRVSASIAARVDLDHAEEAAFLARHFDLFTSIDQGALLAQLLQHLDWRVRAGLADALLDREAIEVAHAEQIANHLVHDDDYKVRAAVARAIATLPITLGRDHVRTLLSDSNWHVREQALRGVLAGPEAPLPNSELADIVLGSVDDPSWLAPPAPARKALARVRLLTGSAADSDPALFGLLREIRTGWTELPPQLEQKLAAYGKTSPRPLTTAEAQMVERRHLPQHGTVSARERYRRLRGHRSLQIALDVHAIDRAIEITNAAVKAGVEFLEVGDPLIKRVGVEAIELIKRHAAETSVVAEMMSADWGRDQVELAAEAGADVVLLIGPASAASVSAAVAAARRLGVALTLDAPCDHVSPLWLRDMERAGVDGFVVTTNIDLGVGGNHPLETARTIRACTQLPVAVSGGFSTADEALASSTDWDVAIVGRSVADAVDPVDMAHQLSAIVRKIRSEDRP